MAQKAQHGTAVVPPTDLTRVPNAEGFAAETDVDEDTAEKVLRILEERAGSGNALDIVVVLDEWAFEDWSDYDVATEQIMVVGKIEDYSEKAYLVNGAFEVLSDELDSRSLSDVEDDPLHDLLGMVDETDEDFHDEKGEQYIPKSAVEAIIVVDE